MGTIGDIVEKYTCIYVYIYIYMHIHVYMCVYIYIYIHTHIYICIRGKAQSGNIFFLSVEKVVRGYG